MTLINEKTVEFIQLEPVNSTSVYAVNDVLFAPIEVNLESASGLGGGRLEQLMVTSLESNEPIELFFFLANPADTPAINAAFTMSDNDLGNLFLTIKVMGGDFETVPKNYAQLTPDKLLPRRFWVVGVTRSAYDYVSAANYVINMGVLK